MPALHDLDSAECQRLLRRGTFGRIVLVTPEGPEIVPVNYAAHDDCIVIRTAPDGVLARHGHQAELVFEIDFVDDHVLVGWSVVARGTGAVVDGVGGWGSAGTAGPALGRRRPNLRDPAGLDTAHRTTGRDRPMTAVTDLAPADVLLADGSIAVVRPLCSDDGPALHELHGRVSDEAIRLRFFSVSRHAVHAYVDHVMADPGTLALSPSVRVG